MAWGRRRRQWGEASGRRGRGGEERQEAGHAAGVRKAKRECACSTLARNVGRACEHRTRHSFACLSFSSSARSSSMSAPACLGPTHPVLPASVPHTCTPGRGRTPPPPRIHAHTQDPTMSHRQSVSHACPSPAALGAAPIEGGLKFRV
jgi:hypothetical protein